MENKKLITWVLSVCTIIDDKETKKTGLGLIFVGIIFIIVGIYILIRDFGSSDFNSISTISFFSIGVILIIIAEILRRGYFR